MGAALTLGLATTDLAFVGALVGALRGAFLAVLRTVFFAVGCAGLGVAVADFTATLTAVRVVVGWFVFSVDMFNVEKELNVQIVYTVFPLISTSSNCQVVFCQAMHSSRSK